MSSEVVSFGRICIGVDPRLGGVQQLRVHGEPGGNGSAGVMLPELGQNRPGRRPGDGAPACVPRRPDRRIITVHAERLGQPARQPGVPCGGPTRPYDEQVSGVCRSCGLDCFSQAASALSGNPSFAVAVAEVVQRAGEVGQEGGVGAGQLAVDLDGFLGRGQRVLAAPHLAVADAEVVQRAWRGRAGRPGWRWPARGTIWTASSVGASASWRRPTSL